MKTINRLFLVLLFGTLTMSAMAQEGTSGIGVQFGFAQSIYRLNSWDASADPNNLEKTFLNGLKVGLVWEASYIKGFGSMVGLNYTYGTYTSKWKSVNEQFIYPQTKERNDYHQLELFVDWQYKIEIAGDTYLILYTGPTIQAQLSLTTTEYERTADAEKQTTINRFDYDDDKMHQDYKRFNVTWGVGAGFQYDRFYIRGGYDFGLINPYKITDFAEVFGPIYGEGGDSGRYTKGRLDQWHIKFGVFFAQFDK